MSIIIKYLDYTCILTYNELLQYQFLRYLLQLKISFNLFILMIIIQIKNINEFWEASSKYYRV